MTLPFLLDAPLPPATLPLSREELASRIGAALADNNVQGISAEDVRSRLYEIIYSLALSTEVTEHGTTLATTIPGLSSDDTQPVYAPVQAWLADPVNAGRKLLFPKKRAWLFNTTAELALQDGFNIEWEPGAVFDYTQDTASSTRVRMRAAGSYGDVALANNPFATVSGSPTVTVTHASHGHASGDVVCFFGAVSSGGLT